ncbi:MAG: right-handed parallel beta-helix repeat-containing protein [Prolixibacteraceae bacterium]
MKLFHLFFFLMAGVMVGFAQNNSIVVPACPTRVLTVGGKGADVQGYTSQAIQTAVNALRVQGGGVVKILAGEYEISAPIRLFDSIRLSGSGEQTILKKSKGVRTNFVTDAGYGELQLTVADTSGFAPGMGVQIYDSDHNSAWDVTTAVITAIRDHVIYIDNYLIRDYVAENGGTLSNACSVISAEEASHVAITDLVVDGNRESNDALNGCRGGGIYLHKVRDVTIENVHVRNFDSDGISWQITENVTVRNCEVSGCANAGLHPGAGTLYTRIEGNYCHNNDIYGLFVCWRVRHGIVRGNRFTENGHFGIDTGHMDTDMLFEENQISQNGHAGVHFRPEIKANAPHRNVFRNNTVENNGGKKEGYGFLINSPAEDVVLDGNIIRNSGGSIQKAAVFIGEKAHPVKLVQNQISGHSEKETIVYQK